MDVHLLNDGLRHLRNATYLLPMLIDRTIGILSAHSGILTLSEATDAKVIDHLVLVGCVGLGQGGSCIGFPKILMVLELNSLILKSIEIQLGLSEFHEVLVGAHSHI